MKSVRFSLLLGLAFLAASRPALSSAGDAGKMNVLLVTIDTLRPDRLSCYDSRHVATPNLDALAKNGVLFTRAFAHTPNTLPSHADILLGLTPQAHGVHDNSKSRISDEFLTLAEHLKIRGYATAAFVGAFPLDSKFGLNQGFDIYDDFYPLKPPYEFSYAERKAEEVVRRAVDWLVLQKGPWFAWIHLWDPHTPYSPPEPYASRFKDDPYSGEVAYVDAEIGKLLAAVSKKGDTLIVVTSDHGESLGEHGELTHGYFAYNSTLWVPLLISGPGIRPSRCDAYVSHADLFPTICEGIGIPKPAGLQGSSLRRLLEGKNMPDRPIYIESLDANVNRDWAPIRGFIADNKKYLDSPLPEYFDLEKDFQETANLAGRVDLAKVRAQFRNLDKKLTLADSPGKAKTPDRDAQERLRSLGYIVGPAAPSKKAYGEEDDLKKLLPLQQKLEQAILLKESGRVEESISVLKDVLASRRDFIAAYSYLSYVYMGAGREEEAIQVLTSGAAGNPGEFSITVSLGLLLVKTGKYEEAIKVLNKAASLNEHDLDVWNYLGLSYWRTGQNDMALAAYEKALAIDDTNSLLLSNMGAYYLSLFMKSQKHDDRAKAIQYLQKAADCDPSAVLAYRGLGIAYQSGGMMDEAVKWWEKGLSVDPNDEFLLYNLGVYRLQAGDKKRALEYLEKYLFLKRNSLKSEDRKRIQELIEACKKDEINPRVSLRGTK